MSQFRRILSTLWLSPFAFVLEENAVPIVEEPLPQENMAPEVKATLPIILQGTTLVAATVKPEVPNVDI